MAKRGYQIVKSNGMAACISESCVKLNGRIVYRGSDAECSAWVQAELEAAQWNAANGR